MKNPDKSELESYGIEVREHWLGEPGDGGYTGEFQTIFLVILSGIAGGFLSGIGKDIWEKLKTYIKNRYRDLEVDRKKKELNREERRRICAAYLVYQSGQIPIIYYAYPSEGNLELAFDKTLLAQAENDIKALIRAGKVREGELLGIHLTNIGTKPFLRQFKEIPSGKIILEEMAMKLEGVEAWTHALVAGEFENLNRLDDAQRHYETAMLGEPRHAGLLKNLGIIHARKGNLQEARKHWESAAAIENRFDLLHYNIACFYAAQGDVQSAANHLRIAVSKGFRDIGMLMHDAEFARIINAPEIVDIVRNISELLKP